MNDLVESVEFVGGPRCGQTLPALRCMDVLHTPEVTPAFQAAMRGERHPGGVMFYRGIYRRAGRRSAAGRPIFEWEGEA